jgi:hypothetical protein
MLGATLTLACLEAPGLPTEAGVQAARNRAKTKKRETGSRRRRAIGDAVPFHARGVDIACGLAT